MFRSRGFWGGVLFLAWLGSLEHTSSALARIRANAEPDPAAGAPGWLVPSLSLLCACAYLLLARRLRPARLPTWCLAIGAAATALGVASPILPLSLVETIEFVLIGLAWISVINFGMHFIRPDAAALGFYCLLAIPKFATSPVEAFSLMLATRSPPARPLLQLATVGLFVVGAAAWALSRGATFGARAQEPSPAAPPPDA
jgi:hypothetical protein